jgi:hypothetical protein
MPFPPKPIDQTLHGVIDYSAAAFLFTAVPRMAGISGTRSERQIRTSAAVHAGYSMLTDYPLGVIKAIPFKGHLMIDAVGALALAATPFVTGQWKKGPREWVPHVALAVNEFTSLALTDPTGKGDFHGDIEAVRAANLENPHRKIHDGPRAVEPATA